MKIIEIYNKYHIPKDLQLHMLRVSACAYLILENWKDKEINKESIIRVCLLHDMGNMAKIKDNPDNDEEFIRIREKYVEKFGLDDHLISLEIGKELGLNDYELKIMEGKESKRNEEIMNSDSFEIKICAYCDERVSPYGVESIKDRLEDAKKRYKGTKSVWGDEEKANHLIDCAIEIEKQIMQYCDIEPEKINDENVKDYIVKLQQFDIKNGEKDDNRN